MHAKVARVAFMRAGRNPEHAAREIRGLGSREALGPPCPLWQQHSMKMEHQRSLDCTWLSAIRACGWSRSFTVSDPIENQSFRMFQYAQFGAGPRPVEVPALHIKVTVTQGAGPHLKEWS